MTNSSSSSIPTIDLSPFFKEGDEDGRRLATQAIGQACSDYGFFQIYNHGVPLDLINRALQLSKGFFDFPDDQKLKSSPTSGAPVPAGYNGLALHSPDNIEYFLVFPPESGSNVYPPEPIGFREVLEEFFFHLTKTGLLIESIISKCLGLPPNFLGEFNNDRSCDLLNALHYFPATENDKIGVTEHEDGNCVTFVFQDDVGGLQVRKNGEWIAVPPLKDTIVVNVGDVIQVLSNKKFKSATHRVVGPEGKSRYSYAFYYSLHGDKWVEPLPVFSKDIGEPPKYRGFLYKEYQQLRLRNKTHPPSSPEDVIHITHYEINDG